MFPPSVPNSGDAILPHTSDAAAAAARSWRRLRLRLHAQARVPPVFVINLWNSPHRLQHIWRECLREGLAGDGGDGSGSGSRLRRFPAVDGLFLSQDVLRELFLGDGELRGGRAGGGSGGSGSGGKSGGKSGGMVEANEPGAGGSSY